MRSDTALAKRRDMIDITGICEMLERSVYGGEDPYPTRRIDKDTDVFVGVELLRMTQIEVARMHGVSPSTIRHRLERLRLRRRRRNRRERLAAQTDAWLDKRRRHATP